MLFKFTCTVYENEINFILLCTYIIDGNFVLRLWACNELPLNTYISMYGRTNRCYNERGSRTNSVRSSTPHCTCDISGSKNKT